MRIIGFNPKPKKGYFGDNEIPTIISANNHSNFVELKHVPYFELTFKVRTGYQISSGFECNLDDDTNGRTYSIPNHTIVDVFQKIQSGEFTVNPVDKTITGIFSIQKKNKYLFLYVPTQEELDAMIQDF